MSYRIHPIINALRDAGIYTPLASFQLRHLAGVDDRKGTKEIAKGALQEMRVISLEEMFASRPRLARLASELVEKQDDPGQLDARDELLGQIVELSKEEPLAIYLLAEALAREVNMTYLVHPIIRALEHAGLYTKLAGLQLVHLSSVEDRKGTKGIAKSALDVMMKRVVALEEIFTLRPEPEESPDMAEPERGDEGEAEELASVDIGPYIDRIKDESKRSVTLLEEFPDTFPMPEGGEVYIHMGLGLYGWNKQAWDSTIGRLNEHLEDGRYSDIRQMTIMQDREGKALYDSIVGQLHKNANRQNALLFLSHNDISRLKQEYVNQLANKATIISHSAVDSTKVVFVQALLAYGEFLRTLDAESLRDADTADEYFNIFRDLYSAVTGKELRMDRKPLFTAIFENPFGFVDKVFADFPDARPVLDDGLEEYQNQRESELQAALAA